MSKDFTYMTKATRDADGKVYILGKVFGSEVWIVGVYEENYRRSKLVGTGGVGAMTGLFNLLTGDL